MPHENNNKPYFEMATDDRMQWHWVLWSGNGRQMATNAVAYPRRKDAQAAIVAFVKTIKDAKLIVKASA